jgi:CheY-like chemotaxis protein
MLRRRLHALLASAQVFEERALSLAVQDLIARLDVAQSADRPFTRQEIDAVSLVVASLPTYIRPSLQPAAAYSDVRELLAEESEQPTNRPAADGSETWRPPPDADPAQVASLELPVESNVGPVVIAGLEVERDNYVPAVLAESPAAAANDLDPAGASELESGARERPLHPRARRIIALSGLQPGPGGQSRLPESEVTSVAADPSSPRAAGPAGGSVLGSTWSIVRPAVVPASAPIATPEPVGSANETEVDFEPLFGAQQGIRGVDSDTEPPLAVAAATSAAASERASEAEASTGRGRGWTVGYAVASARQLAGLSTEDRPTVESLPPVSLRDTEVPSVRPSPSARDSHPGAAVGAATTLFVEERSELQAEVEIEAVSEIMLTLAGPTAEAPAVADASWSRAVAEAGEELAAWRDSLQPSPIPPIDIEDESAAESEPAVDRAEPEPVDAGTASAVVPVSAGSTATEARSRASVDAFRASERIRESVGASTANEPGIQASRDAAGAQPAEARDAVAASSSSAEAVPLTAASVGANDDAQPSQSAGAVTKLRRPARYIARGATADVQAPAAAPADAASDPRGDVTKLRRPAKYAGRSQATDAEPTPPSASRTRHTLSTTDVDVVADAGRAGFGGGAAALETLDVGSASELGGSTDSHPVPDPSSAAESPQLGSPATIATPGATNDDPITLDMRPDIAEWADSRTEIHERSQSLPRLQSPCEDSAVAPSGAFEESASEDTLAPESRTFAVATPNVAGPTQNDASTDTALAIPAAHSGIADLDFSDQTSPGLGPPVLLKQTVSGLLPVLRPARLLLVADASCAARTIANLSSDAYEVVHADGADAAIRCLHDAEPDIVLVSVELASLPEVDLVRRLKTDPLGPVERVHVLLPEAATFDQTFLEQISADGAVSEPLSSASLEPLLRKSARTPSSEPDRPTREGSIDDIAAQIAEEIRRGVAESLRAGKHDHTRSGDGSQLMAAAWSAIGRVRSHLADHTRGQAREAGQADPSASLLPTEMPEAGRTPSVHPSQLLAGQRVLVADDDPAVLWFFVGLLREASAHVLQAHNGREALELARRKQPHVIVSDILMPKLDGFGLCRELKRDALLSHVPVILLSWKDDLLQRMRELDAGAAGYLRKEAGSQQILAKLTEVLQPRTRLVAKLRGHAEVSGSLGELGALSMLELVAAERPDAHIAVRDALNLFEVDIRGGRRVSVTRTAADGAFTRGDKALMQLLGLAGGEFHVSSSTAPLKAPLPEPLERALAAAGRRLSAIVDAVSDARLLRVCLIAFDDDVLQSLLSAPSTRLDEVVALFRTGNATAEGMLREGRFAPGELEDYLRELARCVAITGVWDANGEDLVAAAQRERETPQLALLSSTLPPRSRSGSWSLAPEKRDSVRPTSRVPDRPPEVTTRAGSAAPAPQGPDLPPPIIASSSVAFAEIDSEAQATAAEPPIAIAARHTPSESDTVPEALPPSAALAKIQTQPGIGPESQPPELPDWLKPQATIANTSARITTGEPLITPPPPNSVHDLGDVALTTSSAPPSADGFETDAVSKAELDSFDLPIPSTFARAIPERSEGLRLAGTLIVLAAVGYFGWQQFILTPEPAQPVQTRVEAARNPPEIAPAQPVPTAAPAPARPAQPAAPTTTPAPQAAQPTIQNTQFGKVLPFVDASRGVSVGPDQGLLVIEFQAGVDPAPYIRVGSRELGKAPLAVALPAGRHELVVRSGKSTSFRYLIVRAGETRIVSVPLAEL